MATSKVKDQLALRQKTLKSGIPKSVPALNSTFIKQIL